MVPTTTPQPLYTSAPILDYDDEPQTRPVTDDELVGSTGVLTLEGAAFDAAILEALVNL